MIESYREYNDSHKDKKTNNIHYKNLNDESRNVDSKNHMELHVIQISIQNCLDANDPNKVLLQEEAKIEAIHKKF